MKDHVGGLAGNEAGDGEEGSGTRSGEASLPINTECEYDHLS